MIFVSAAIIKENGKILICQRGENTTLANLWEFPGGKQEINETAEQCVIRECKEELDIDIKVENIFLKTNYKYLNVEIFFTFFSAKIEDGKINLKEHQDFKWVFPNELEKYKFCPADIEVVQQLLLG